MHRRQNSDTSSVSSSQQGKKHNAIPLVKKWELETALMFDPHSFEDNKERRLFGQETDENGCLYHTYKSARQSAIDTISGRNYDNRTYFQGDKSDVRSHHYIIRLGCNCSTPCQGRCPHPVFFIQKVKGIYNCRMVDAHESNLILKSTKDSNTNELTSQKDKSKMANDALLNHLKGTEVGKAVESQYKQIEKGFEGDESELSLKKSHKRTRAEATEDVDAANDDDNDDMKLQQMEDGEVGNSDEEVDGKVCSDDSDHEAFDQTHYPQETNTIWAGESDTDEESEDSKKGKNNNSVDDSSSSTSSSISSDEDEDEEVVDDMNSDETIQKTKEIKKLFKTIFTRQGYRIPIKQINKYIQTEVSKDKSLTEWYNKNTDQVRAVFDSVANCNQKTGYYEYRD